MKTIHLSLALVLSTFYGGSLQAQTGSSTTQPAPTAVLVDGDVTKFIETLPKMQVEFEALGLAHDADQNDWLAHAKAQEILAKYGWDYLSFGIKWSAIASAYMYLKSTAELNNLSAEERAQAEQYMGAVLAQFRNSVHENDIALVRGHETALDAMFNKD